MTDDPIKLFVVVMSILLCVLGFVAYASYNQANDFERALQQAPDHAKQLRELAADVQMLCDQLKDSSLGKGHATLISDAAKYNRIKLSSLGEEARPKKIGTRGRERRFKVEINRSGGGRYLTREEIAKFCRTVENDSRNILKTIELTLKRDTSLKGIPAGTVEEVINDKYSATIVFGLRVIK